MILESPVITSTISSSASMESIDDKRKRLRSGTFFKIAESSAPSFGAPSRSAPQLVRSTPDRTTSAWPAATNRRTCSTASTVGTERELPRPKGMMQNVQRWSQPFCTCTKARVRPVSCSIIGGRVSVTAIMSDTSTRGRLLPGNQLETSNFSSLPKTRETSGMAANISGSVCAAQPVTIICASGFSLCALRIACRACRVASDVTAQVLKIIALVRPAFAAAPRMISDSNVLSLHPKLMSSGAVTTSPPATRRQIHIQPARSSKHGRRSRARSLTNHHPAKSFYTPRQ